MRPNIAISNFVSRCKNQEPPVVYGDGSQTRDFTYIEEIIKTNLTLIDTDVADGQAINIENSDTIEILTLAKEVRNQLAPLLISPSTTGTTQTRNTPTWMYRERKISRV